jgi:hypothetical protein
MNQPTAAAPAPVREEERVLPITYERALAMLPRLVKQTTGAEVAELGDGYFVATTVSDSQRQEMTIRLGRNGADTRLSVRVETSTEARLIFLFVALAIVTFGLGLLVALPWAQAAQRKSARARELLVHKTFRCFEDAVAEQGTTTNYRVAPGADANVPGIENETAEKEEQASRASRT